MRATGLCLFGVLMLCASPAPAAEVRIGVLTLRAATGADEKLATLLTPALVQGVAAARPKARVLGWDEVEQMLDATAAQQMLGCSDDACVVDLAKAIEADLIVAGTVGKAGGATLMFVSVIAPREARVIARASEVLPSVEAAPAAIQGVAARLFLPDALKTGDRYLKDLRMAVVVEEYGDGGSGGQVAGCVTEVLHKGGSQLVRPERLRALKKQIDPRYALAEKDLGEAVTDADADALLVGTVDHAYEAGVAKTGDRALGLHTLTSSFMLVAADSGAVLATEQLTTSASDRVGQAKAKQMARKALCEKLRPVLVEQLDHRLARGMRVTVEVDGVVDARTAAAVLERLSSLEGVIARARLRKQDGQRALVDVTTLGRDGVALALALAPHAAQLGLVVDAEAGISPSTIRLVRFGDL